MKVICDKCKTEILDYNNIKNDVFNYCEEKYSIKYFQCENCKHIYPIEIGNKETEELREKLVSTFEKYSEQKDIELYNQYKEIQRKRNIILDEIKKKFNGWSFSFATENNKTNLIIIPNK